MKTIGAVTVARSDWSHLQPLARALRDDPAFDFRLYVTGGHLQHGQGNTTEEIWVDGFKPPAFSIVPYALDEMDALIVYGDRSEMLRVSVEAATRQVPIIHISGGDISYGSADNQYRHAISKLAALHFPSNEQSAGRLRQMGEEAWRIHTVGELSLDRLETLLAEKGPIKVYHCPAHLIPVLVTLHPDSLRPETSEDQAQALAIALADLGTERPINVTAANADPGGVAINALWKREIDRRERLGWRNWTFRESFGFEGYALEMAGSACMVGNSSSGLCEAPSFGLPVVDVGDRQSGRLCAGNVIHVGSSAQEISEGIKRALSPAFRASLSRLENPYYAGGAVDRIMAVLRTLPERGRLLRKEWAE